MNIVFFLIIIRIDTFLEDFSTVKSSIRFTFLWLYNFIWDEWVFTILLTHFQCQCIGTENTCTPAMLGSNQEIKKWYFRYLPSSEYFASLAYSIRKILDSGIHIRISPKIEMFRHLACRKDMQRHKLESLILNSSTNSRITTDKKDEISFVYFS